MDTIFALASGRGRAGVAVIRVSGPGAPDAVAALAGDVPPARRASLRALRDVSGSLLDRALVLVFPEGASFTGEATAELHLHGSPAVVAAVSNALAGMPGLRPAEPGEFTRRALENGRLDLGQVEGLADLIDAETEAQRRQAQRLADGALGARVADWRAGLIRAAALIAAGVDFADEDIPEDVLADCVAEIRAVRDGLRAERAGARAAERLRDGFEIAIVGPPNAGKSTLLNYLAGREAALTSEHAGTTRDVIEVRMDLSGLPVTLLDMAGLRKAGDPVEALGVAAAERRAKAADLRVFLLPHGAAPGPLLQPDDIVLRAKADLDEGAPGSETGPASDLRVSGRTGAGVPELLHRISSALQGRAARPGVFSRMRHLHAAEAAEGALEAALARLDVSDPLPELVAEDLRRATHSLESLTGKVDVEDLLGEIFARFCIGK